MQAFKNKLISLKGKTEEKITPKNEESKESSVRKFFGIIPLELFRKDLKGLETKEIRDHNLKIKAQRSSLESSARCLYFMR